MSCSHHEKIRPARFLVLGLALAATLAASMPADARTHAGAPMRCAVLTSIHWSSRTAAGAVSGTHYAVLTKGISCSRALQLVPGLITQSGRPFGRTLRGPAGYTCTSDVGGNNLHAIAGVCQRAGGSVFLWGPKIT